MTEVRRRRRGHLGAPVVGAAVTGVLAYVVFALTTRTLGSEAAAPVSAASRPAFDRLAANMRVQLSAAALIEQASAE